MIELNFEAVAVIPVLGNRGQKSVALCAQADVFDRLAVDDEIGGNIFLIGAVF